MNDVNGKVIAIITRKEYKGVSLNPLTYGMSIHDAEDLRRTDAPNEFHRAILTIDEVLGLDVPPKQYLLRGLIAEGTITLVNGERGIGKSWFTSGIANAVTAGCDFGPWKIEHSVPAMIIDGEMSLEDSHRRAVKLNNVKRRLQDLYIYSDAYAYQIGLRRANLLNEEWRENIRANVKALGVKLIVLDNLASLAPGIDENEKLAFDPINRWLLELRYDGVTIIMVHHTGKSGQQRGTSAHEDHVDTCFVLKGDGHDEGKCRFHLQVTKDRSNTTGRIKGYLRMVERKDTNFDFDFRFSNPVDSAIWLLITYPETTQKEAEKWGITKTTYFRAKNRSEMHVSDI